MIPSNEQPLPDEYKNGREDATFAPEQFPSLPPHIEILIEDQIIFEDNPQ